MVQQSTRRIRKKKALAVLPLVIIPFLTLAFWALGGGGAAVVEKEYGLNMHLPDPQLKEGRDENKLSFYNAAEKDSAKQKAHLLPEAPERAFFDPAPYAAAGQDADEEKVYRRLEQLQRQLQGPAGPPPRNPVSSRAPANPFGASLPAPPAQAAAREDSELEQLNAMMDKILDIQHPQRVRERQPGLSPAVPAYTAAQGGSTLSVSLLDTGGGRGTASMDQSFYGTGSTGEVPEENTIGAVVHGTQKLKDGAVVKLRLAQDFRIGDMGIPRGTFLYGIARQQGERLQVSVSTLRHGQHIFPVALQVYDMDGLEGIHIPGTASAEVARSAFDPSWLPQADISFRDKAAAAGLQAAQRLLTRKSRQKTVTLKGGYQVLLRNKRI